MTPLPHRRFKMTVTLEADRLDDALTALDSLKADLLKVKEEDFDRSGNAVELDGNKHEYNWGASVQRDSTITGKSYFADVQAFFQDPDRKRLMLRVNQLVTALYADIVEGKFTHDELTQTAQPDLWSQVEIIATEYGLTLDEVRAQYTAWVRLPQ